MNKKIFLLSLILASSIAFYSNVFAEEVVATSFDKIVAIVNDEVITQSEIDQRITILKKQFTQTKTAIPSDAELKKQMLNDLIIMTLELQIAKRSGIDASNDEVKSTIESIAKQNNMTLEQFELTLEKSKINLSDYRKQVRNQLIVNRLIQEAIGKKSSLTEEEVSKFIKDNNLANPDSEETIKQAQAQLYQQKMAQKAKEWLTEMKKSAYIKVIE